jgi:hypothetical protein
MMSGAIGQHFQWKQSTEEQRRIFEAYIRDGQPAAVVVFDSDGDSADDALRLARAYPATIVIYRKFIKGDNQYLYLSPQAWCAEHAALIDGPPNLFSQIDNEPNAKASAPWMLATMKAARASRIRAGIGGYGVGQPSEDEMQLQSIADIVAYMAANAGWFVLLLHEYTRGSVFVDFARHVRDPRDWPTAIPANTTLYLMGRYKAWHRLADKLRVARPKVIISEFGYDYVAAVSPDVYGPIGSLLSSLPTWAGWSSLHPEIYAARMLQRAKALFYADPDVWGWVNFCWSNHPTDWGEWNSEYADLFRAELVKGFDRMTAPTQPPTAPAPKLSPKPPGVYNVAITNPNVTSINLRSATGAILTTLRTGARVEIIDKMTAGRVIDGDPYDCYQVQYNEWRGALLAITKSYDLEPVTPAPDRYAALAAKCRATSAVLRAEADKLDAIATEAEAL